MWQDAAGSVTDTWLTMSELTEGCCFTYHQRLGTEAQEIIQYLSVYLDHLEESIKIDCNFFILFLFWFDFLVKKFSLTFRL